MNRKLITTLTLIPIIVMLGMFAVGAASPASAVSAQGTVIAPTVQVTLVPPVLTAVVPVTGDDPAGPNILTLLFYGFLGLLAIVLLVALFASANRTTYVRRDSGHTHDDHDHLP